MTKNGVTTTFTYRSDGLRASKTVNGVTTNYIYDGQTVVGETRSDGTSSWYTPGANGYISRTDLDNQGNVTNKEWFVYDGLGSCRALVKPNAQGTEAVLVARYDYDVYGAVRTQSGSSSNKFKYVASIGHPTDEETGLIYMRARYYEPSTGRFVSEDPAYDGINWYVYTADNPINAVDPDGRSLGTIIVTDPDMMEEEAVNAAAAQKAKGWMLEKLREAFGKWGTDIYLHMMNPEGTAAEFTVQVMRNGHGILIRNNFGKEVFLDLVDLYGHGGIHLDMRLFGKVIERLFL